MPDESFGEKTEPATPRRRKEARERGQTAKSVDLNGAIILLAAFLALFIFGDYIFEKVIGMEKTVFQSLGNVEVNEKNVQAYLIKSRIEVSSKRMVKKP